MDKLTEKLNEARALKRKFKLEETVAALKECLEIDPKCLIASAQAGFCLLLLGRPAQAEGFLSTAFEQSGRKDVPVGYYLAAALTAQGKEEQAQETRQACIEAALESNGAETYMLAAEMMAEKEQYPEALRLLDVLSTVYAQSDFFRHPVNHYRLIRVLAKADVIDIAGPLAQSLYEETPESWEGLAAKAAVAVAEKQYEEAYAFTVQALRRGGASNPLLAAQQHWLAMNK